MPSSMQPASEKGADEPVQPGHEPALAVYDMVLAGFLRPRKGRIRVAGADIVTAGDKERLTLCGLVLQNPDLQLFAPTINEEISKGEEFIERFGLSGMGHRHPRSLSFGQKRRLALARFLARNPRLLVIDELSVGQDSSSLKLIFKELCRYLESGGGLVLTTHDQRVTKSFPGTILRLEQGKLSEVRNR